MNKNLPLYAIAILLFSTCGFTARAAETSQSKPMVNAAQLFDGERAMGDLVKQVEFGPRLPGSPGIEATRKLILDTLSANGFETGEQAFKAPSPLLGYEADGKNLFGVYPKGSTPKFLISAHYDTRPYADQDPDPSRRNDPVPGANDGATGVAVLLELARALPKASPKDGVALVFFDLEDHGQPTAEEGFCKGSQYFARNLPAQVKQFQYGINLDMVGGANLQLPMEGWSIQKSPKLAFALWESASKLYPEVWLKARGPSVYDDHMPFIGIGKQYIDVIDIKYPQWHTIDDTPQNCSVQSLDFVGDAVLSFILHPNGLE